jgi:hypothetical protein
MDWPADISFIVLLFDGASSEVQWSLRFPPTVPQLVEDECVRRFVAARSMVRAFFSGWVPKNSGNHADERWPSPCRVEKVVCTGDTVLAAVPVPGNQRWLFGTFVHCPQSDRPDMRYLSPALLNAVLTIGGDAPGQSSMLDMSTLIDQLDLFRSVLLPGGTICHDSRSIRDAKYMVNAFIRLIRVYHETDEPLTNPQRLGSSPRPRPRHSQPGSDGPVGAPSNQTLLLALKSKTHQEWIHGCCVLSAKDGAVMHYQGMQGQHAGILSWYFMLLADAEKLLHSRYEKHRNGRSRAWVRHNDFVLCFDLLGMDAPQNEIQAKEADGQLTRIAAKILSDPSVWTTSPQRKQSFASSSIR